jgi:hypothetical protein
LNIKRGELTDKNGFHLDGNEMFRDAIRAFMDGAPAWLLFGLFALVMSPWIIPAISKALYHHRTLSHKREANLLKLAHKADRRSKRRPEPDDPSSP